MVRGKIMDKWHGDEMLCNGNCGFCEDCHEKAQNKADDAIERYRFAQHEAEIKNKEILQ